MRIRKAKISDVKAIQKILETFAGRGDLLPRSLSEIYANLRDYNVIEEDQEGKLLGTCALHIIWEGLAEIKSLAVVEASHNQGIGTKLVESCLSEAITLGLYRVFALTYRPEFFARFGFKKVDKNELPHKVWSDCLKCHKFPECDEVAVILDL
jgi:amino-acid N-acetyltransferase